MKIVKESYHEKNELVDSLAKRYGYEQWRVRIFDMQRASVHSSNPPVELLPGELNDDFKFATLVMQGNGFSFTTSENTSEDISDRLVTPYRIVSTRRVNGNYPLELTYDGQPIDDFNSLRLIEIMGSSSLFYFPFKDKKAGLPLPTYLIVNPYENCAYRCVGCSRLPFFGRTSQDYEPNIGKIVEKVLHSIKSPENVKFINIITGSNDSAQGDIKLFEKVIQSFNDAGFSHCEYGVQTSNVESKEDMGKLRRMGVIIFTVTTEVTTPEARKAFYGPHNKKGRLSFKEIIELTKKAESIFLFVNMNIMLGYEPADELKRNLERLACETKCTINHYLPRIFLKRQLDIIHSSARNLEYYVNLFAFIERMINAGKKGFSTFFEERFEIPQFGLRFRS